MAQLVKYTLYLRPITMTMTMLVQVTFQYRKLSRLSTTTSARIESYEEVTGKSAGQVLDDSEHIHHESSRTQKPKAESA